MNRNEQARDQVAEKVIQECRSQWHQMSPQQQASSVERICRVGGLFQDQALARIEGHNCPQCGSSNLDRGLTGLDLCNVCGAPSREGMTLREHQENRSEGDVSGGDPSTGGAAQA